MALVRRVPLRLVLKRLTLKLQGSEPVAKGGECKTAATAMMMSSSEASLATLEKKTSMGRELPGRVALFVRTLSARCRSAEEQRGHHPTYSRTRDVAKRASDTFSDEQWRVKGGKRRNGSGLSGLRSRR